MNVEVVGDGEPKYAVVGLIHGDEPCGKKAIERFKESKFSPRKGVKLILANEKAFDEGVRFVDDDLNRVFPGDKDSDSHEERLAAKVFEEVKDLKVLDLHSTKSYSGVFAAQSSLNEEKFELAEMAGVENISFHGHDSIDSMDEHVSSVCVECGFQGSDEAAENAYQVLINFLAAEKVLNIEAKVSRPDIFKIFHTVEKPDYSFTAENFEPVEKGQKYAESQGNILEASQKFYPVLMSTHGYQNILGHKAKKIEKEKFFN